MKNIKFLIAIIFIFILIFLPLLSSCNKTQNEIDDDSIIDDEDNNNGDSNLNSSDNTEESDIVPVNDKAVWGKGISLRVVIAEGSDFDTMNLIYKISEVTETPAMLVTDIIPKSKHEFVIGKTNRQITQKAYNLLYEKTKDHMQDGWLLYTEDSTLSLAYTSDAACEMALEYIEENFLNKNELVFENDGVVHQYVYNIEEYADQMRDEMLLQHFERIEKELGKSTADALKKLYTLYTPDVYQWLAGLYDPEIGGFYFSVSGRDNYGFLPDIESTVQALNHLNSAGMFAGYNNNYVNAFTDEMKAKILSFAKNLQSADDGYFYHPQWGKNIIVARRGRDLGWATQLIKALGGKPYYNTPGGVKGELGAPGSAVSLTSSFLVSKALRVASVKAANSYLPDHLRTLENWITYIDELDIYNDPYTAGNTLAAQHNEIEAAGDVYIDYLTSYLTDLQDKNTGFWGDGVSYLTMNGFMKLSHSFSYYGKSIPCAKAAMLSTIEILLTPDTADHDLHVCSTYNTWVNFNQIFNSLKKAGDQEALISQLRELILEKAPQLITITYDKLSTHKRDDGGFSYMENSPCNSSQKAPVACSKTAESDVNATAICTTGIISNLFSSLGISKIPIYCDADARVFLQIIENKPPIEKNDYDAQYPTLYGERGKGSYFELSNQYNTTTVPVVSTDSAISILSKTEDRYVYFYKNLEDGQTNNADSLNFSLPSPTPENAVGTVIELDIAFGGFSDYTGESDIAGMQINMHDGKCLSSVYFDGGSGNIKTKWSKIIDGNNISLKENTWYNLRLESYEYDDTRAVKIFVNGEYQTTILSADKKSSSLKRITISLRQYDTNDWIAIDNLYVGYLTKD